MPELVHYFLGLQQTSKRVSITDEAVALLQAYSWPGNVRQLQAIVEIMASRCNGDVIRERDVCQAIPEIGSLYIGRYTRPFLGKEGAALVASEKKRFQKALIDASGDRNRAAQLLKVSRATFFRRAKELGLVSPRKLL